MEFLGPAVRQIRKEQRLTLEDVANQVRSYDSGNMSRFERGIQSIDTDKLTEIAQVLGMSVSEIYARAEQLEADAHRVSGGVAQQVSQDNWSEASHRPVAYGADSQLQTPREERGRPIETPASDQWEFVLIPSVVVNKNKLGAYEVAVDTTTPPRPVPRALFSETGVLLENAALVPIVGDAMASTLFDGDQALVDRADKSLLNGKVYILRMQDELWARRVKKTPAGIILIADNKTAFHDDLAYTADAAESLEVIGRVRLRWGSAGL